MLVWMSKEEKKNMKLLRLLNMKINYVVLAVVKMQKS